MNSAANQLLFGMLKAQAVITLFGIQLVVLCGLPLQLDEWAHWPTLFTGIGLGFAVFGGVLILVRSSTAVGLSLRAGVLDMYRVLNSLHGPGIVAIALAAGISEEILFRAFLQVWLGDFTHVVIGIVVNSVIFGLLHFNSVANLVFTTLYGLALSIVYHATENLALVIIWHAAYDLAALYLLINRPEMFRIYPKHGLTV